MQTAGFRLLALTVAFSLVSQAQEPLGLEALCRLDRMPSLRDSLKVGSVSSYDRTGGNDDGFSGKYSFIRKDPEGLVLADLQGPGIIYRVWTPTPTDDLLEFIFDGEAKPRIQLKFRDLFLGNAPGFPAPLVGFGAGGFYCYVPIPFEKSCIVRMRAPKVQFYQINYALFGPGKGLKSFSSELSATDLQAMEKARNLFNRSGTDISSYVLPPGSKLQSHRQSVSLKPGGSASIFRASKAGRLVGLRITPADALAGKARDLVLKISFDGEPTVVCPAGDFFGYAWGQPATQSLLVGTSGVTNYCYFPMPFDRDANIELLSDRQSGVELQTEVLYCSVPRMKQEGKFYALWRRENPTTLGQPYTFLETAGRGHLVGLVLQAQGLESGKTLFFEGDDETTIDGQLAVHGTGSEDFFNGGWYDVPDRWEKRISFPLSGCLGYAKHLGRTGAYRLFLGDAYPYRQGLKQTIEHSGQNNDIPTDYCSVTYFYSDQPPKPAITLPPLGLRGVQDPREVIFPLFWQTPIHAWSFDRATLARKHEKVGSEDVRYLSLSGNGEDWFGSHFISFACDLPETGKYTIYIEALKGAGQGQVQLFQNENPVAAPVDLYAEQPVKSGRVSLGQLKLTEGRNNIMLKLVGKNEKSSGLSMDLIQLVCVREP